MKYCLVDSMLWIDHLSVPQPGILSLQAESRCLIHEDCIVEVMLGSIGAGDSVKRALRILGRGPYVIRHLPWEQVVSLVRRAGLGGIGIQAVDAQLLSLAYPCLGAESPVL